MINRLHELLLVPQRKAVEVHRTTIYCEPTPFKQSEMNQMKSIQITSGKPSMGLVEGS